MEKNPFSLEHLIGEHIRYPTIVSYNIVLWSLDNLHGSFELILENYFIPYYLIKKHAKTRE